MPMVNNAPHWSVVSYGPYAGLVCVKYTDICAGWPIEFMLIRAPKVDGYKHVKFLLISHDFGEQYTLHGTYTSLDDVHHRTNDTMYLLMAAIVRTDITDIWSLYEWAETWLRLTEDLCT